MVLAVDEATLRNTADAVVGAIKVFAAAR